MQFSTNETRRGSQKTPTLVSFANHRSFCGFSKPPDKTQHHSGPSFLSFPVFPEKTKGRCLCNPPVALENACHSCGRRQGLGQHWVGI